MKGALRRAGVGVQWLALGMALAVVGALVLPLAFQGRPLTVLSGSMEPALMTGDVVVVRKVAPLSVAPGDIVTFREPNGRRLITHRVRHMRQENGVVHFVTKGDANRLVERWKLPEDRPIRRVLYRIPLLGYGLNLFRTRIGLVLLVGVPLALLAVVELWSIWRPEEEVPREAAA
jgi:signal peptidase